MTQRETIAERLASLMQDGVLTPDAVVEDAKSKDSPLHEHFDWSDSVAGAKWRLMQAREIIRSVRIEVRTETKMLKAIAYVRDPASEPKEQGYVATADLRKNHDLGREALLYELARAVAAMRRARELSVAFGLEDEVDLFLNGVETFQRPLAARLERSMLAAA